jgi:hypothetical protein
VITPRDVLDHYVRRHNDGVRSGDFEPLLELFLPDARIELVGVAFGPFVGKPAIARAFEERPPTDELVIGAVREQGDTAVDADYAWKTAPSSTGGTLRLEIRSGSVARLSITVA